MKISDGYEIFIFRSSPINAWELLIFETEADTFAGRFIERIGVEANLEWFPIAVDCSVGHVSSSGTEKSTANDASTSGGGARLCSHGAWYLNEVGRTICAQLSFSRC